MSVEPIKGWQRRTRPPAAARPVHGRKVGKGEVLLAGVLALAVYTSLLLRLPYRSFAVNALLSTIALSSLYAYVRFRLNILVPLKVLSCLVLSIVLDMIGNRYGLFSRRIAFIPFDILTHFVSSGLGFIPVMWLLSNLISRFGYRLAVGLTAFFSVTTTFSLAAYYEITELIDERLFGGHRIWSPRDTSQDLAADLVGIVVAAIAYTLAIRMRRRLDYSGRGRD
jgi:uncharacterized membrane protein YjdF